MSSIDDRLQRVRAFLHFQSLNPDKCHVSPEAEDAIAFAGEIERLRGLLENSEADADALLKERDETERMADRLAAAISALTGVDIGEHSSGNCPWTAALEAAEEYGTASQPKDVVCNCDDHDARYCVNRASRISPCRCGCHGASDTAAHSGEATTTGTQPTSLTNTDKSSEATK